MIELVDTGKQKIIQTALRGKQDSAGAATFSPESAAKPSQHRQFAPSAKFEDDFDERCSLRAQKVKASNVTYAMPSFSEGQRKSPCPTAASRTGA